MRRQAGPQHRAAGEALAELQPGGGGLKTGRTIRFGSTQPFRASAFGDDKYGDFALNKQLGKAGLKRMFLHAAKLGVSGIR